MSSKLAADIAHPCGGTHSEHLTEFCDVKAAAEILGISVSFLNKSRVAGNGPPFLKFGHSVRYSLPALHVWATSQARRSTSDPGAAV